MLKIIECDKFYETPIVFHSGLNTIIGDDVASNSIGKSNMLMIIDFVFGGADYINRNNDTVKHLGEHTFKFVFEFDNKLYYFSRDTESYNKVNFCDENYEIIETVSVDDYCEFLKDKYDIANDDLSFRGILSLYFRIYGRENLNEKRPLLLYNKQKDDDAIILLVKLFKKYDEIKKFDKLLEEYRKKLKALKDAINKNFLPRLTKTLYKSNEKRIDDLESQLNEIKRSILQNSLNIEALITKDILQLRNQKSDLVSRVGYLQTKLKRTNDNIAHQKANIELELSYFTNYFPDFNINMIEKVDAFHSTLTKILKKELQTTKKELEAAINDLNQQISEYDKKISEKLEVRDAPKYAIDKIVEIASQIKELKTNNGYYAQKEALDKKIGETSSILSELKDKVLAEISSDINQKMNSINQEIYLTERRPPVLTLTDKRYSFQTFGDTGTGTACAGLITYDLSILELTDLPALAHDLPLLKNIEDNAIGNIMKLYSETNKQVFIAIDKVNSFNKNTSELIYKNKVLYLSKDKLLFKKNWKNVLDQELTKNN